MKRIRFTEEQIIAVLREQEAGAKTVDLARKHGISEATLYGGMEVSDAKRLRALEDENRERLGHRLQHREPHSSLGYKTPAAYADTLTTPKGA